MKLDDVRKLALSMPYTTEEPHQRFSSFRVKGKIFVTVPPDGEHVNIFVADEQREVALAMNPQFVEKQFWGDKVVGVRVRVCNARADVVDALIRRSYERKVSSQPRKRPSKPARRN
jgi:hypothetical protein